MESRAEDLQSQTDSLRTSFTRLNARVGMREVRERRQEQPTPPPTDTKAALRRSLGLFGPNAARVAQRVHHSPIGDDNGDPS